MWYLFLISFSLAFVFGQFARVSLLPGLTLLGLDIVALVFGAYSFGVLLLTKKRTTSTLTLALLIFSLVAALSLLGNLDWVGFRNGVVSLLYHIRFLAYFGMFLFIANQNERRKTFFEHVLLGIIGLTVVIGLFQIVYYPNLRNLFYLGWDDHLYRLFSVFLDPNYTGVMFVLFLVYLVYCFFKLKKRQLLLKTIVTGLFIATFFSVFLTYSRTALVMLVFGGVFYLGLTKKKSLLLIFALVVFLLFMATINPHVEGLNPFRTVSTKARLTSYQIALNIFRENPVLGVGFNTYRYAQNKYGYRVGGAWEASHADAGSDNSFLLVLATTGLIGFIAFSYLWYQIIVYTRSKSEKGIKIAKYALISIISVFIASFFVNALFYPFVMAWIWSMLALTERTAKT